MYWGTGVYQRVDDTVNSNLSFHTWFLNIWKQIILKIVKKKKKKKSNG